MTPAAILHALPNRRAVPETGEILGAAAIARGGLLLFGWHGARLPRQGAAAIEAGGQVLRASFRLHAWAGRVPGTAWFVAVVQLRDGVMPQAGATVSLPRAEQPPLALGTLPAELLAPERLADRIAAEAGTQPGTLALFLAELALAAPRAGALRTLLVGFLAAAATDDGVIEITGQAAGTLMLQGWGRAPEAEPCVALLCGARLSRHAVSMASFPRPDIAAPATGLVMLLAEGDTLVPGDVAQLYLVTGQALLRRAVLPARQLLSAAETAGHMRDMLPRLACEPEVAEAARRMMRPRFAGAETLGTLVQPVRAAVDLACIVPGVGAYLAGWLVDPRAEVDAVHLCDATGRRLRLDAAWTRTARPDVAEAFAADSRFAGLAEASALHGFAAFLPDGTLPPRPDGLHLDLELGQAVGFLPVTPARGSRRALLRRALAAVDLHRPGAHGVIARQLGPLLRAALAQGADLPDVEVWRKAPSRRRALLLPMPPAGAPPQTALSFLLVDPPSPEESLVLICPPCWGERELGRLDAALALYGQRATILRLTEPVAWTEALEIGARAVAADVYACLGGFVLGAPAGWRAHLAARLGTGAAAAVAFPTTLYEDNAVRSIGIGAIERLPAAPWSRAVRPLAGRPVDGLRDTVAEPIGGTLSGALVTRAAWLAAGGFAGEAMLADGQEIAFFRRLRAASGALAHVDAVRLVVPDEAEPRAAPWLAPAALADGWLLAAALGSADAPAREVA